MLRPKQAHWITSLILLGFAVGFIPTLVQAQAPEPQKQPSDYFWYEVSSGTVGALAGGFVTAMASLVIVDYLYDHPCSGLLFFGMTCRIDIVAVAGTAFLIGNVIGGTIGIVITGSLKRVRGNVLMSIVGAMAGAAVTLLTLGTIEFLSGMALSVASIVVLIIPPFLPFATALGAALGHVLALL